MVLCREKPGQNRPFLPLFKGRNARLPSMFTKSWGAQSIEHLRNSKGSRGIASTRLLDQELQQFQIGREKIKTNAAFMNDVFHIIPNCEPDSEDVQDHKEKRFRTSKPKYNWLEGQYEPLYGVLSIAPDDSHIYSISFDSLSYSKNNLIVFDLVNWTPQTAR